MNELRWLRSHVERCLQDIWDVPRVEADTDGDYPFRCGTAACYIRIEPGEPHLVRVWAVAADGVRVTGKLLREVNDVNLRARTAGVTVVNGKVVVEQALHADGVDRSTLAQACSSVGQVADDIGGMIATVYGGFTPFPAGEQTVGEEAS